MPTTDPADEAEPYESVVEAELRAKAELARLDALELEAVTRAVHQVSCAQLECTHAYPDEIPGVDIERAQMAIVAMRRWRERRPE